MEKTSFKTKLKRVMKAGLFNFWRSGYVSFASILVMVETLFVIGAVMFSSAILNTTLQEFRDKVDINVYFVTTAPEEDILALKNKTESLPEVKSVVYVSREQTLANFKLRHENNQITLQALEELGENPFGASLNIKAKDPSQYETIANFLNEENILASDGNKIIDENTYFKTENQVSIDRLSKIIRLVENFGRLLSMALVIASIIVTLSTIRLTIYICREEISVMQLVGASKNYIRGPFVVTGIIVGAISGFITVGLFFPTLYFLAGPTQNFFMGFNIFNYYLSNLFQIVFIIIGSGVGIGAVSSYLAVRKYLKL